MGDGNHMKKIPNFPKYSVTDDGRVWSNTSGKWLSPTRDAYGYLQIGLFKNGKKNTRKIHRLVLEAYVGPCPDGMECLHKNGNSSDNRLANLKWGTHAENMQCHRRPMLSYEIYKKAVDAFLPFIHLST